MLELRDSGSLLSVYLHSLVYTNVHYNIIYTLYLFYKCTLYIQTYSYAHCLTVQYCQAQPILYVICLRVRCGLLFKYSAMQFLWFVCCVSHRIFIMGCVLPLYWVPRPLGNVQAKAMRNMTMSSLSNKIAAYLQWMEKR